MSPSKFDQGMEIRKSILGETHVENSWNAATEFDRDFQEFITETAWGSAWARPGLDLKTRHMIVIAVLSALGREKELALHINASHNSGITQDEMKELLIQVAPYAGIPASLTAFGIQRNIIRTVLSNLDQGECNSHRGRYSMTVGEEMRTSWLLTVGDSSNHGQGPGFHVHSIYDQKFSDKY